MAIFCESSPHRPTEKWQFPLYGKAEYVGRYCKDCYKRPRIRGRACHIEHGRHDMPEYSCRQQVCEEVKRCNACSRNVHCNKGNAIKKAPAITEAYWWGLCQATIRSSIIRLAFSTSDMSVRMYAGFFLIEPIHASMYAALLSRTLLSNPRTCPQRAAPSSATSSSLLSRFHDKRDYPNFSVITNFVIILLWENDLRHLFS